VAGEVHRTARELERRLDHSIAAGVTRHRQGAEEVGVSETLIAVRLAQALSALKGVGWEQILEERAEHHRSIQPSA
jgi:hypothetical protein